MALARRSWHVPADAWKRRAARASLAGMHAVLFGVVAGTLLSCLRAPLGLSLAEIPAAEPRHALGYRALALAVLAAGLWARGGARLRAAHVLSCALGLALHGWLLAPLWMPGSHAALLTCAASGLVLLILIGRKDRDVDSSEPLRIPVLERLAWLIAGSGAGMGIELIARQLRLHGQQLPDNDTHFALMLLLLIGMGGSAFAWIGERPSLRRSAPLLLMALFGLALYGSLSMQQRTASTMPLREYLGSFGLDLSMHGTLLYDGLIAASLFVLPAFALGTVLRTQSDGRQHASLCLGAALGVLGCTLVGRFSIAGDEAQSFAMQWIPLAAGLAIGGALLGLLSLPTSSAIARWSQLGLALACLAPIALVEVAPRAILAPWSRTPVAPYMLQETPAGLMSVEGPLLPDSITRNVKQLTLERRILVSGLDGIEDELAMIDASVALLTADQLTRSDKRVLLIGQLTPLRARRLSDAGFSAIDRTACWWPAMDGLEKEYFGEIPRPKGAALDPDAAMQELGAGKYTLVIVPPVHGTRPAIPSVTLPPQTTLVIWLDSATPLSGSTGAGVLHLAPSKIDRPLFARVLGPMDSSAQRFVHEPAGGGRPLRWLLLREWERDNATRSENFHRVASTNPTPLALGLELLYTAQERSSPFENPAESFELPTRALDSLRTAPLDPTVRFLWQELGIVLAGKRWIPQLYDYLEPLARENAPWPELERQLAIADAESLEFESALARLLPIKSSFARNPEYWRELGKIQEQLGLASDSVQSFRSALGMLPGDHDLERRLALQLVRAGDPEGTKLILELLQEHPDDEELKIFAGSGPYPPPKRGYSPQGKRHDH